MALDIELYRRTVYVPARYGTQNLRRISVIDIHPEGATLAGPGSLQLLLPVIGRKCGEFAADAFT